MIEFLSETEFTLPDSDKHAEWIETIIKEAGYTFGEITYVFCDDDYLHKLNIDYLKHDTLTDIISFDYSFGKQVNGEIYISVERVKENALEFNEPFERELKRVIIHGILHFLGHRDKSSEEEAQMRLKENEALAKFPY